MLTEPPHGPLLPRTLAFVVQLREDTDVGREQVSGRVEHIATGHAAHFDDLEELLAFIRLVLDRRAGGGSG